MKMKMSTHVSETEQAHTFVCPNDGEQLPSLLRRCIPKVQAKRADAYNRLNKALRESNVVMAGLSSSDEHSKRGDPLDVFDQATLRSKEYPVVCAHVTEDLKLCSEAIMRLRGVLSDYKNTKEPLCNTPDSEVSMAVKWLDTLQDLEERKLLCTVSVHAISRSNAERAKSNRQSGPASSASLFASSNPDVKEKLAGYAKQLDKIDTDINFLLQEVMEYWLEYEEME